MIGSVPSYIPSVTSCSYPPREGNAVRPLVDAVPAFRRIYEAVTAARHSVVLLVPADPEQPVRAARYNPQRKALFDRLAALGRYENFALVGIAAPNAQGSRSSIYVHAKVMLVDDAWVTIGSCNLHAHSLGGHTEMNAAIWDRQVAHGLRCELLAEHLGRDTAGIDDRAALRLYREIARDNCRRRDAGDYNGQGLAFSLDPATYGA